MPMTLPSTRTSGMRLQPLFAVVVAMSVATGSRPVVAMESTTHPLDPLTALEYTAAITVLKEADYVDDFFSLYPLISLQEPAKADVLEWKPGDAVSRSAFVLVKKGPQTFEAVVDLTRGEVVSWKQVKGVEPGILLSEEWTAAQRQVGLIACIACGEPKKGLLAIRYHQGIFPRDRSRGSRLALCAAREDQ